MDGTLGSRNMMTSVTPTHLSEASGITPSSPRSPNSKSLHGNTGTFKLQSPAAGQKSVPTSPKVEPETNDTGEKLILGLSEPQEKMIDNALDSIACDEDENGVSQGNDNSVNENAESESEVTPKWPGLEKVHVMTDEEIVCHNKYIDNLIAMEIENEKREMLLYLDELLEMTEKEVIKDVDLKQPVLKEIVVRINNDEFVNGEVVEKYISMKFLDEQGRYSFR